MNSVMDNLNNIEISHTQELFDGHFLDEKSVYLHYFKMVPSMHYINKTDGEKMYDALIALPGLTNVHSYRWYDHKVRKFRFSRSILVFDNNCLVELNEDNIMILHDGQHDQFVQYLSSVAGGLKVRERRAPLEINMIVRGTEGLALKPVEIRRTRLDVTLYYEDDFGPVHERIRARLCRKNDRGVVLLHGLPGTGKTTYLRYLVGKIRKKVLFLSPAVAANLMSPDFIDLLVGHPNAVIIIEDAETVIMDRRTVHDSPVSSLLNISDGLMADFLNIQVICTFNSPIAAVDAALRRKGRLIASYEFGKLSVAKAQRLSDRLGFSTVIRQPVTLAEITHPDDPDYVGRGPEIIGFRRHAGTMSEDVMVSN